ncbi:conserved hypothetical protein [Coccidioides posadasii str. Silveira]|uniref:Uncharacterized protein n=1 Tax=Coccidioides posadasii (strain RMSCC 757 / Silveira) TaxID=443226 RepID=E9DJL6_COCPS|nr:conserved hypothetical protein [Coccidioides posadasii str. Silveira]
MLKRIQAKHEQNSSKKNCKMIKDKAIKELMIKQFAKSKSKKYHKHQLMVKTSQIQHSIAAYRETQFCQMIVRLEIKIMIHDHDYLAASLSEDNNSSSASEKMKKEDFEIVMFSDENDKENNKTENN